MSVMNVELETLKEEKIKKESIVLKERAVSYLELYRFATCPDKAWLALALLLSAASAVCSAICSYQVGCVTGGIVDYLYQNTTDASESKELSEILTDFFTISMVACSMILAVGFVTTVIFSHTALRQTRVIKQQFLASLLNQDIPWFDVNQTGDFATRLTEDLNRVEEGIGYKVSSFLFVTMSLITNVVLALVMNWKLTLICMVLFPVQTVLVCIINWVSAKLSKDELDAYADAGAVAEETLAAVRTVYAFEGQTKEQERYYNSLKIASKNNIKRAFFNGVSSSMSWFIGYSIIGFTLWLGIKFIMDDRDLPKELRECDTARLITIIFSMINGLWFFLMLAPPVMQVFSSAKAGASKIFAVIDAKSSISASKLCGVTRDSVRGNIVFKDVFFSYPAREEIAVLRGLSFQVEAGQTVALVGASGCGKSTCVQLIQRFYDADDGSVLIDGTDVKELNLAWLRRSIGVVEQEPSLFEATIADNIRFGREHVADADVVEAAQKANAHDFIKTLPDGYETVVGERGTQLSGGQKQRIAIARALIRNPAILLLDEATSALDVKSEALVQKAIDDASHGCTTVIVAHRLSTIRKADKIIVICNGRVAEEGTHDSLMELKNHYYQLVTSQVTTNEIVPPQGLEDSADKVRNVTEIETKPRARFAEPQSPTVSILKILKLGAPECWITALGSTNAILGGACFCIISILYGKFVGILQTGDLDYLVANRNAYALDFLYVSIISAVVTILQFYMLGVSGEKLILRVRSRLFKTVLSQEIAWFDNQDNSVGALCVRLSSDAATVQQVTGQCFGYLLYMLTAFFLALAICFYHEWHVTLAALALYPVLFVCIGLEQKIISDDSDKLHRTLQQTTKIAVEAISNIRTVTSLGCDKVFLQKYLSKLDYHEKQVKKNIVFRGLVQGVATNLMFLCYTIGLYYGGILIMHGQAEFASVFITTDLLAVTSWSLAHSATFLIDFEKGYKAAQRIVALLSKTTVQHTGKNANATNDITYQNVHFTYPERPLAPILKGLNLSVLQGKVVALVGPSGCGKSTVVQLLQRFYDPDLGNIALGPDDLKTLSLLNLRLNLGVVSQEPNLFSKTIRENIAYGDNTRVVSYEEVTEAARKANIHSFITSLPLGYDTKLGERGLQLSGGQKQRIAIARALVRNPKVLLLDEATSALDAESEKIVQKTLDDAKVGRTCIIIAHRLSTIEDADVICVLHDGKVAETGTHSELLSAKGIYYRLYNVH